MMKPSRDVARIRRMMHDGGISLYQLEASFTEPPDSSYKSEVRFRMIELGISIQDLKKGTLYESLEKKGWNKEDIEKEVKAMKAKDTAEAAKIMCYPETYSSSSSSKGKVYSEVEWLDYIRSNFYDDEHVRKDIALYGNLDGKFGVPEDTIREIEQEEEEKAAAAASGG